AGSVICRPWVALSSTKVSACGNQACSSCSTSSHPGHSDGLSAPRTDSTGRGNPATSPAARVHCCSAGSSTWKKVSASATACSKASGSTASSATRYSGPTTAFRNPSTAATLSPAAYVSTNGAIACMNIGPLGTMNSADSNSASDCTTSGAAEASCSAIAPP